MTPKLSNVIRLDSLPLSQTFFTPEGYLIDRPILTSTGIFEYHNPDGSIRRELRLPEDVFNPESLKSYKSKPVIVTHDAGLVTKDNVDGNMIGTILTDGYRSGDDVRAEIVIHNTDEMRRSGLRELSLGYNLDLEETPGEWNGQHYDAIQRNIRINHLALVREARAGEQARLNIDSRDPDNTLKGGKVMSKKTNPQAPAKAHRTDGTLTPEEFAKAVEEYKARRAQRLAAKADSDAKPAEEPVVDTAEPAVVQDEEAPVEEANTPEAKLQLVKDRRDRRDEAGDPENMEAAQGVIAQQDEDMSILFDIIDTMLANADFQKTDAEPVVEGAQPKVEIEVEKKDDEPVIGAAVEADCDNADDDDAAIPTTNASEVGKTVTNIDSVDAIVRQRIQIGMIGQKLNMDGLENMGIMSAKKAVILAVRPGLRLDGKSEAYINAMYDCAVSDVNARSKKDTSYQKQQMFNKDSRTAVESDGTSSADARQRMIDRQMKKKEDK